MTNEAMISVKNSSSTYEKEIASQSPNRNNGTGNKGNWKPLVGNTIISTTASNSGSSKRLDVNVLSSPSYINSSSDEVRNSSLTTEQNPTFSTSFAELTEENRQFITLFTQSNVKASSSLFISPHHHPILASSTTTSDGESVQSSNNNSAIDQRDDHGVSAGLMDYERRLRNSLSETTSTLCDDSIVTDNRDIKVQNSIQQSSDRSNLSIDNVDFVEEQSSTQNTHGLDRNTNNVETPRLKAAPNIVNDQDNEHLTVPVAEKERLASYSRDVSLEGLSGETSLRQQSLSQERQTPRSSNRMPCQYRETSPVLYSRGGNRADNPSKDSTIGNYESSSSLLTPRRSHSVYNFASTDTENSQRNGPLSNNGEVKKKLHGVSPRTPRRLDKSDFTTVSEESSYDSYSYFVESKDASSAGLPATEMSLRDSDVQNSTQQSSDRSNLSIHTEDFAEEHSSSQNTHGLDRNTNSVEAPRLNAAPHVVNDLENEHLGVAVAEKERLALHSRDVSSEVLSGETSLRQQPLSHERLTPRSSNRMSWQYRETSPVIYSRGGNREDDTPKTDTDNSQRNGSLSNNGEVKKKIHGVSPRTPRRFDKSDFTTVSEETLSNNGEVKKKIYGVSPRTPRRFDKSDFTTVSEESSYDSYSYFMESKDASSSALPATEITSTLGSHSSAFTEIKPSEHEAFGNTTHGPGDPNSVIRCHKAKDNELAHDSNGIGSDIKIKPQSLQPMITVSQKPSVSHAAATLNEIHCLNGDAPLIGKCSSRDNVDVVESHVVDSKKSKFDEEASSESTLDFDGSLPSSFTEQKEAGQARRAVNELLQSVDCQVAAKTFLHVLNEETHDHSDDRSISSYLSASSKASLYNKYGVPYANGIRPKSKLQKNSCSTDDESLLTVGERRHSRVLHDSESTQTSETNSSSSMSLQTTFQRTFSHFRQRLSSSLNAEHYDDLQQLLKEDFEALILKHRKDNRLLSKKYYHEKQKNEAAKAELSVHEEEIRNLKHELSLMDAERDEIEDRLEKLRLREERRKKAEEAYVAEIVHLKEMLGNRDDKVDSAVEKQLERTNGELLKKNASLKKRVEDIEQDLVNKDRNHVELLKENQFLKQKLEALESQSERASVLKDLLDEFSRSQKITGTSLSIEANEYKEKMQEMETKLQAAKSQISEHSKYQEKALELETKLGVANDRIVALEKLVDSKERAVKSILEEVGEIREKSMIADDSLQQEIISLKKKISSYEALELAHRDDNAALQQSHMLIKQLEQERGTQQMNYNMKVDELEKKLSDKCIECAEIKRELDRVESIRLGQEETARESFNVIQNYQSKIVELERRLIERHDEIFRMREEIQNVNQDLAVQENSYQKTYLSMQRNTVQLKKEKQELEHLYEETSYELDTVKSDLLKTTKEKNRLQQALDDANSEIGSLVAHINEQSQIIEQHSKEISLKNQAYEKLSAELQKTKASSENAEEELSKLIEAMIGFEKSETTKDQTISSLSEESETLKLEIASIKASSAEMLKHLESKIDAFKKENELLSGELVKLREENAAGRNYCDLAEERSNQIEELRAKLSLSENYCKSLEESIVTMRSDLIKNEVETLPEKESEDLKRLKSDLLTSQKQKVELEKRIEHMAKLLSKAESIIARTNTITLSSVMETFRKKETNLPNNKKI